MATEQEKKRADDACDCFDAEVFSGDTFISYECALILKAYAERWLRSAESTIKQGPDDD
ncbi:hypothetical protein ACJ8S7_005104 [Klebsiella pneumoniae]|nr:hypothetical protein [Klebsiella pneumoniae]